MESKSIFSKGPAGYEIDILQIPGIEVVILHIPMIRAFASSSHFFHFLSQPLINESKTHDGTNHDGSDHHGMPEYLPVTRKQRVNFLLLNSRIGAETVEKRIDY